MKVLKAASLSLLLAWPALAHAQVADVPPTIAENSAHYADGEMQTILDWQRLVAQANRYRYRLAAEKAARLAASLRPADYSRSMPMGN
jgi:hypothetical protein